jgi:hypothetical protein
VPQDVAAQFTGKPIIEETSRSPTPLSVALAVSIGASITLCVYGYQFGRSNHTVYLLSALHHRDPHLLAHDWFTMQTFQYHAVFTTIVRLMMAAHALEGAFLVGYFVLIFAFHIAWMRLAILLGGSLQTYLVSVLMYHLSAGGTALGMYQFFQDSSFLPSNIANVLLLAAIVLWIDRRGIASGICIGLAGLFHLNHAVVGAGLWIALIGWDALANLRRRRRSSSPVSIVPWYDARFWIATACAVIPCAINVAYAMVLRSRLDGSMPLEEFVALYVRLRHPHHYDPSTWPSALWVSFLWPLPLAIAAYAVLRRRSSSAVRHQLVDAGRIFLYFWALVIVALLGAGIWYVSEPLVQLSLYRFSIYIQLMACIGAALLFCDCAHIARVSVYTLAGGIILLIVATPLLLWIGPRVGSISVVGMSTFLNHKRGGLLLFAALSCAPAVQVALGAIRQPMLRIATHLGAIVVLGLLIAIGWDYWIGLTQILEKPRASYLQLCAWAEQHTPVDAIFIVPPSETEFRYHARRAIVVNFKGVPQFSGELAQWRDRLENVLGIRDLQILHGGFDKINPAMNELYAKRSADELIGIAHEYHAGYIVALHSYDDPGMKLVQNARGQYLLYAVTR